MDASRARETALASGTNEIRVIPNESTRCRDCRIAFRCGAARLACDAFRCTCTTRSDVARSRLNAGFPVRERVSEAHHLTSSTAFAMMSLHRC
jgi:hypothetical protein